MAKNKTPAPRRAGTDERELARLISTMGRLRNSNPEGYRALMRLAETMVEKISTKGLTQKRR